MSLTWRLIVTRDQFADDLLSALGNTMSDKLADPNVQQAVDRILSSVTDDIEGYLHRGVMVEHQRLNVEAGHWDLVDERYEFVCPIWPVVQVVSPANITIERRGRVLKSDSAYAGEINLFVGWRNRQFVDVNALVNAIDDVTDEDPFFDVDDYEDLSALPPAIPDDIVSVAINLAILQLENQVHQLVGETVRVTNIAQARVTTSRRDRQAKMNQLESIKRYRRRAL